MTKNSNRFQVTRNNSDNLPKLSLKSVGKKILETEVILFHQIKSDCSLPYLEVLLLAPGLSVLDFFEETSSDSNFLFEAAVYNKIPRIVKVLLLL